MKKVLIVLPNDKLGGAEQFLKMIAKYYLDQKYFVRVLFLKKKEYMGWKDLNSQSLEISYTKSASERKGLISLIKKLIKKRKTTYDLVWTSHIHLSGLVGIMRALKLVRAHNFIGRESTSIFKRFKGIKLLLFQIHYWLGYRYLDLLVCQTNFMKTQLLESSPGLEKRTKVEVLPNPIDLKKINSSDGIIDSRLYESKYLVAAGRLIPEKGFDVLIKALGELKNEYPNLKLIILGDGYLKDELEKLKNQLLLSDDVQLMGHVDNVFPYFNKADVCVVSSRIEGFPNVLLQMMSQNNKVVSTTCAGDIDKIEGIFLAETDSVASLKNAIRKAMISDTSHRRELFNKELESRSIESFVSKVESLIQ